MRTFHTWRRFFSRSTLQRVFSRNRRPQRRRRQASRVDSRSRPLARNACQLTTAEPELLEQRRVWAVGVSDTISPGNLVIGLDAPNDNAFALVSGGLLQVANQPTFTPASLVWQNSPAVTGNLIVADVSAGATITLASSGSGYTSIPTVTQSASQVVGAASFVPGMSVQTLTISGGAGYTGSRGSSTSCKARSIRRCTRRAASNSIGSS